MTNEHGVIELGEHDVIDLAEPRDPSLLDVARSAAIRRAASRAIRDLDLQRAHAPWIAVCTATSEIIAASPSFDPDASSDWRERISDGVRWDADGVPIALIALGQPGALPPGDPALAAAELVVHALSEIVVAEHRAEVANARAGRAEALAATDALTGLANQRAWWDRVTAEDARIARSESTAVVAVVDLDDLKVVNDERGHLHGDLLLRLAARTLRQAVRASDLVARVGGDEFAVLAVDYDGPPSVLAARIEEALAGADIRASVGTAASVPGTALVDVFARADQAMYEQKRGRRRHAGAKR